MKRCIAGVLPSLAVAMLAILLVMLPHNVGAQTSGLLFSEYIEGSSTNKAIEIYNGTGAAVDLAAGGYNVQMHFNGNPVPALTINLTGTVANGDVFVLAQSSANATILAQADQTNGSDWFNGDDAIVLRKGTMIVDSIGQVGVDPGTEWGSGPTGTADNTLRRRISVLGGDTNPDDAFDPESEWEGFPIDTFDGLGSHMNSGDAAPSVTGSSPANNATNVERSANIVVNFSELVNVAAGAITVACPEGIPVASNAAAANVASITIDPAADLPANTACKVTIGASGVSDSDAIDPPDTMTNNVPISFTTADLPSCDRPATKISAIQGSGATTPIPGQSVAVQGVVTGIFPGLSGFYLQEEPDDIDANPATSEGIFVFLGSSFNSKIAGIAVGDTVRVTGTASEFTSSGGSSQTQIGGNQQIVECTAAPTMITPVDVTFPLEDVSDPEAYEGMLVRFPQELVIAEYFNYDRFGEIVLGYTGDIAALQGRDRFYTPTSIVEPAAAAALQEQYDLRQITLDDGRSAPNPAALRHPNGDPFSLDNRFRGGDLVEEVTGIVDQTFGLYRVQPTAPAAYTSVNQRPTEPEDVGGGMEVAAFNTLNYFLSIDTTASNSVGPCGPSGTLDCRGADTTEEFVRQRAKLLQAILGLDAEILGLNELENTTNVEPLADIVAGLNEELGAGTYDYIDTGTIGTDAIKVGMIYKPAVVTPVGDFETLDSRDDPRFVDTRSRPSLAQSFEENATGARFTVVVNHLKSKGSGCGAGDDDPVEGNCNLTRTNAAEALVDWLATDPTDIDDADYLIVGDLNSYDEEDPIDEIKAGADDVLGTSDDFTDLVEQYQGEFAYSYVFDGQAGYLDYALATRSLAEQVTGATEWHINADEPDVLDYDMSFKPPAQEQHYEVNAFRTSDHDPVLVGLALRAYGFDGFYRPVDNLPAINQINAGGAVPVRFSLDGDYGLQIFTLGYPASQRIACDTGAAVGPLVPEGTARGSRLEYNASTYTYIWNTDKSWAGTCRQLVIQLDDGTYHRLRFQLE